MLRFQRYEQGPKISRGREDGPRGGGSEGRGAAERISEDATELEMLRLDISGLESEPGQNAGQVLLTQSGPCCGIGVDSVFLVVLHKVAVVSGHQVLQKVFGVFKL